MIRPFRVVAVGLAAVLMAACGRESPTAVGGSLLTGGGARTFEILLDAPQFLVSDSAVSGFVLNAAVAPFHIVARSFGGVVNAHALATFVAPTKSITVLDSTNTSRTDTLPSFFQALVVLHVDTAAANGGPVTLQLYRTVQQFDPFSATWALRVDTGNVQLPWATPGGTVGALVDTAVYQPGDDSVIFHVDSSTVAEWADTTNLARGALVTAATPNSRMRFLGFDYIVSAHSSIRKDTVVTQTPGVSGSTFIFTPGGPTPQPGVLMIGGIPVWRSFFTLRPDLATRTMTCPASAGVSCSFTLKTVKVNFAGLLVQPASTGAWVPEDTVRPEAFTLDTATGVPLNRSPIGVHIGSTAPVLAPQLFSAPTATSFTIPITPMVAAMAGDTVLAGSAAAQSRTVAVLHYPEPGLFGVAGFYGLSAGPALAPKLRLIITIAPEVQLP